MKKLLRNYSWALWFGISMSAFGKMNHTNWQLYAILVPMVILISWSQE